MQIGKRNLFTLFQRLINYKNYFAIINFFKIYPNPISSIINEIFSTGKFPRKITIKNKEKENRIKIYSPNDFSTLNLIFCRKDYHFDKKYKIILDIGSNIGLSGLYWLTKSNKSIVYCYEPSSRNFKRLKENLSIFKNRVFFYKKAISNRSYQSYLNLDESGVYSSLNKANTSKFIGKEKCTVLSINKCIERILKKHKRLDMIKIDNEGEEIKTLKSIKKIYFKYIQCINLDYNKKIDKNLFPNNFKLSKNSSAIRILKNE